MAVNPDIIESRIYEEKREESRRAYDAEREMARLDHEKTSEARKVRLEMVRLAKETLLENNKSKPVDDRDITAEDITNFANIRYTFTIT